MTHLGVTTHLEDRADEVGRRRRRRGSCAGSARASALRLRAGPRRGGPHGQHGRPRARGDRRGAPTRAGTIVVDEEFRTAVPGIYAAGDVIGFPALASTSMEQARVAVCRAFGFAYKQHDLAAAAVRHLHDPRGELRRARARRRRVAQGHRRGRGPRLLPRQRARPDPRRPRRHGQARLRPRHAEAPRAVTASASGPPSSCTSGQAMIALGGTVDTLIEIGLQLPDAQRELQVRRLRRARPMGPAR